MSRLTAFTHSRRRLIMLSPLTQHCVRHQSNLGTSTSSNQDLISDFVQFAKQHIIEPQLTQSSTRPRYKTLSNSDSLNHTISIDSAENFLTVNDFALGKILPIHAAQDAIDLLHDGIPYWAALMVIPFISKLCFTLPIALWTQRRQDKVLPFIPSAMKEYQNLVRQYPEKEDKMKFTEEQSGIKKKYGFNPVYAQFRPLLTGVVQLPVHMTFYIAIRTMYSSYPDWQHGGMFWFSNLSIADPYWVLPVAVGSAMGLSFWNAMRYQNSDSMMLGGGAIPPGVIKGVFGVMALAMVPIAHFWSAGFNLYMSANILSYMMQLMLLQNNQFRAMFGVRSTQFQMQYQKELRALNAEAKQARIDGVEYAKYEEIPTKKQRKRLQTRSSNTGKP